MADQQSTREHMHRPVARTNGHATSEADELIMLTAQDDSTEDTASVNPSHSKTPPVPIKESPFTTTSDVLESLNKVLAQSQDPNDPIAAKHSAGFELQRRLPDGSARRATESERKAADMQTKLNQVAQHIATLKTTKEKLDFIEQHRQYGNTLYQKESYEEAIDVYLTCLTAVAPLTKQQIDQGTDAVDKTKSQDDSNSQHHVLFCKIMNNLAQSSLKLGWYHKTEQFCTLALEHLKLDEDEEGVETAFNESTPSLQFNFPAASDSDLQQISKLYFRRGKAQRLRGNYRQAHKDLEMALKWQSRMSSTVSAEQKAIQQELQKVVRSATEGKRNKERQARAMKAVLSPKKSEDPNIIAKSGTDTRQPTEDPDSGSGRFKPIQRPLYPSGEKKIRTYSSLRAPAEVDSDMDDDDDSMDDTRRRPSLTYWQTYLLIVARVAEKILIWMGDEEYITSSMRGRRGEKED